MLRLDLTDGDATVVTVEYRELTSVEDASALAPGTKVAVPPGVRIRCQSGILLAHGDVLRVLGGKVAALAAHDPTTPLFMYLPFQAVHTPYTAPPGYNASQQKCDLMHAYARRK